MSSYKRKLGKRKHYKRSILGDFYLFHKPKSNLSLDELREEISLTNNEIYKLIEDLRAMPRIISTVKIEDCKGSYIGVIDGD